MAHRLSCLPSLALVCLLQGCISDSPVPAKTSQDILVRLKNCFADVSARSGDRFVSPCAKVDVASLGGVTIEQLKKTLGPPGISSDDYVPSSPPYECRWAFYRLPSDVAMGGGPELQCVSADGVTCRQVRWVWTQ